MAEGDFIQIEVVYALPQQQWLRRLTVPVGTTALAAVVASGLPGITALQLSMTDVALGIYARPVTPATVLREGDRVEIYRNLQCDPMRARRLRAAKA